MTEQEKKELLIALCGYFPYGLKVLEDLDKTFDGGSVGKLNAIAYIKGIPHFYTEGSFTPVTVEEIRPYLRPMSSMTEEERAERILLWWELEGHIDKDVTYKYQDWLNAHRFDYRGLIEKRVSFTSNRRNV